ncbi:hypothetical protein QWY87_12760 [Lutimonas halocynthiae]|uniref:hypothetical protein n=1 Tax=Lutimonas halocynthiae TaxID=1446477 RepID=UPI0025B5FCCF|nr:hypothetical protein [Lutimonas halocynthiae]MDN3643580.1 hypothetical protein [Lutimonas halocynthiae]
MKKLVITHLLLYLYLLVLVQPALPVLEYLVNYDYIVNELCENRDKPILTCNGKCYLGDQVEKQLDRGTDQQLPLPPQIDFKQFIPLDELIPADTPVTYSEPLSRLLFSDNLKERTFSATILRPPIV